MGSAMKKLIIILISFAALAGTASAATWTMTEVRAEAWASAHVTYFDQDAWDQHVQDIELARVKAAMCKDPANANFAAQGYSGCSIADSVYQGELTKPRSSPDFTYHPRRVDCRGASPSRDAYHFSRFRCRAQFKVGWGDILITVTGKNRAAWRWLR